MMVGGGVVLILGVVAVVAAIVAVLRHGSGVGGQMPITPSPRELLAQRYARGGIDDDEYFQRLSVLDSRFREVAGSSTSLNLARRSPRLAEW